MRHTGARELSPQLENRTGLGTRVGDSLQWLSTMTLGVREVVSDCATTKWTQVPYLQVLRAQGTTVHQIRQTLQHHE